jgi:sarcinarray family protein
MEANMNYKILIFIIIIVLFLNIQIVTAAENDFGMVKAWLNGKNATVEGFSMKIDEPAEIIVTVTSNITGHVFLKITEPGITNAFNVLDGPSILGKTIDNYDVKSGWLKIYKWTVSPNGAWKNGNAPINVFVQFSKIENGKLKGEKVIQFTIANPYILDEQYSGSTPVQTTGAAQPSPAGTSSETQQAPFLSALVALVVILGVWMTQKKTNRR